MSKQYVDELLKESYEIMRRIGKAKDSGSNPKKNKKPNFGINMIKLGEVKTKNNKEKNNG